LLGKVRAKLIVLFAFIFVSKYLKSLVHFLELFLTAAFFVGVILMRELAKCLFDLVGRSIFVNT